MYNKCIFIGRLAQDPVLQTVSTTKLCKFTLAMNHRFKGKDGKQVDEVCFITVVAWGRQAEFIEQYFRKGKEVLIEGRLKQDNWEKDGKQHTRHVVIADGVNFVGSDKKEIDEPMLKESKRIEDKEPLVEEFGDDILPF